jgi:putative heme iron utilization protein
MSPSEESPAQTARRLIAEADRATLATLREGWPYASLVQIAVDERLQPLLLLSDLAEHSKNLKRDKRASLLFDGTMGMAEPLAGPRVTVLGEIEPAPAQALLDLFIARHPAAAAWAEMRDFHLYRLVPTRAHLVAGFGRIAWIEASDLFASEG